MRGYKCAEKAERKKALSLDGRGQGEGESSFPVGGNPGTLPKARCYSEEEKCLKNLYSSEDRKGAKGHARISPVVTSELRRYAPDQSVEKNGAKKALSLDGRGQGEGESSLPAQAGNQKFPAGGSGVPPRVTNVPQDWGL